MVVSSRSTGLGTCMLKPAAMRFQPILRPAVAAQRNRRRFAAFGRAERAHLPDQRVTVLARHLEIGDQHVRPPRAADPGRRKPSSRSALGARARKDRVGERQAFAVVVNDEHAQTVEARDVRRCFDRRGRRMASTASTRRHRDQRDRQQDGERRAAILALAVGRDRAAVQLDQVLDEREAEAEAAVRARAGAVGLPEPLEDVRQHRGRDALAGVADPICDSTSSAA